MVLRETCFCCLSIFNDNDDDELFCGMFDQRKAFTYYFQPRSLLEIILRWWLCGRIQVSKNGIPRLLTAIQLPDEIQCGMYSDVKISPVETLCVILKGLTIPCWCSDTISRFVRHAPQLSMICNVTIHWLDSRWGFKLTALNQQCLTSKNHFFVTTVTHIIWKIIRKITSYCWKISDKKD